MLIARNLGIMLDHAGHVRPLVPVYCEQTQLTSTLTARRCCVRVVRLPLRRSILRFNAPAAGRSAKAKEGHSDSSTTVTPDFVVLLSTTEMKRAIRSYLYTFHRYSLYQAVTHAD